jgi:hypothetical protein
MDSVSSVLGNERGIQVIRASSGKALVCQFDPSVLVDKCFNSSTFYPVEERRASNLMDVAKERVKQACNQVTAAAEAKRAAAAAAVEAKRLKQQAERAAAAEQKRLLKEQKHQDREQGEQEKQQKLQQQKHETQQQQLQNQ